MEFKISPYQVLIAAIAILFIIQRIIKVIKREQLQSFFKVITSIGIWVVILCIALFPKTALYVSQKLGMGENLNTLIFSGFIVVFVILFKLITIIEKSEHNITELVRKDALKDLKKKRK